MVPIVLVLVWLILDTVQSGSDRARCWKRMVKKKDRKKRESVSESDWHISTTVPNAELIDHSMINYPSRAKDLVRLHLSEKRWPCNWSSNGQSHLVRLVKTRTRGSSGMSSASFGLVKAQTFRPLSRAARLSESSAVAHAFGSTRPNTSLCEAKWVEWTGVGNCWSVFSESWQWLEFQLYCASNTKVCQSRIQVSRIRMTVNESVQWICDHTTSGVEFQLN